jgi:hypothetical protein
MLAGMSLVKSVVTAVMVVVAGSITNLRSGSSLVLCELEVGCSLRSNERPQ